MPKPKKSAKKAVKKIPRQDALPGMGDRKIAAIENAALSYAEIRDERQELTRQEVDLKKKLLDLMHKAGKTEYKRNGISVVIKMEEETVKVRVKSEDDLDVEVPEQPSSAPEPEESIPDSEPEPQGEEVPGEF